jgi:uncharacterized protein (DUF924 family)
MNDWVAQVHHFWFEELRPEQWFLADAALDATIRSRFSELYASLTAAPAAVSTPKATVARVIVLDQFPRNMFRGTPAAFAADPLALRTAQAAVAAGLDRDLRAPERQFLYMPFQHSEDLTVQHRSLALFTALNLPEPLDFARQHAAIIARFGRFPHRNAILGRPSTPEEIEFLKTAPQFGSSDHPHHSKSNDRT